MPSDQELFAKGLATYRKVEAANYMAHREVYGLLHEVLVSEAPDAFVCDLGCGTATGSAGALAGTKSADTSVSIFRNRHSRSPARRSKRSLVRLSFVARISLARFKPGAVHWTWFGSASPCTTFVLLRRKRSCSRSRASCA